MQWLAKSGIADVTIDVAEDNLPAIRGIEGAGSSLLGRFWLIRIGERKFLIMPARLRAYGDSP